ncbi:MAG: DNA repair protein RecN [Litorivicinaceae bacterium]|nr:DNA repair protein RecN [Litorivicinaceae bacterium]
MLEALTIQNLATLSQVDLEITPGFTAITGETGAGKSLLLDALELALGERADASLVRTGAERAQVSAVFRVGQLSDTQNWLADNDFDATDELIVRRSVTAEGRSKALVNGIPITAGQLKTLAATLVHLHGQQAHQQLLEPREQTRMIDAYADGGRAYAHYSVAYRAWKAAEASLAHYQDEIAEASREQVLLTFQVEELNAFQPADDEYAALDQMQRQLAGADHFLAVTASALAQLDGHEDGGLVDQVSRLRAAMSDLVEDHPTLAEADALLDQAAISLDESARVIRHAHAHLDVDPERLAQVEARLSEWLQLARKHRVEPDALAAHWQQLKARLDRLQTSQEALPALEAHVRETAAQAERAAEALSEVRARCGIELAAEVTRNLQALHMRDAQFDVTWRRSDELGVMGRETALFLFTPNAGQAGGSLSKIASGGELSRVSLAIEVITAAKRASPTLVFDEVDVGIGGTTAAVVGRMLAQLATHTQLLVVTHQPQVAAAAQVHIHVAKQTHAGSTESQALVLSDAERVEEIARMLGGTTLTETTFAMAKELLANA